MSCVLGLDLSLTSTGACVLPLDWGLDWGRVRTSSYGLSLRKDASEAERISRCDNIAGWVTRLLNAHRPELVVVEQYAFSRGQSHAHALGELGGVVKHRLWKRGERLRAVTVTESRALLGKVRSKTETHALLHSMGAPKGWNGDELDAFVVANWASLEQGGTGVYGRGE